jgi:hypothetical protein
MREIRRTTDVVGVFPDGQSCPNLAAARLRVAARPAALPQSAPPITRQLRQDQCKLTSELATGSAACHASRRVKGCGGACPKCVPKGATRRPNKPSRVLPDRMSAAFPQGPSGRLKPLAPRLNGPKGLNFTLSGTFQA